MISMKHFVAKGINVSSNIIDDTAYVYKEDSRELIMLNETGSFIWNKINGFLDVSEIVRLCIDEYDDTEENIKESVLDFLDSLICEKTIEISCKPFRGVMLNV